MDVMVCTNPDCQRRYTIRNFRPERVYRCKRCRSRLGYADRGSESAAAGDELAESSGELPAVAAGAPATSGSEVGPTVVAPGSRVPSLVSAPRATENEFGRYLDPQRIGRGGMGEILRAVDPELQRTVAIKVLPVGLDGRDFRLRKFLAEAQITGQLEHPNIVPTHELGRTEDGRLYFSMKLVRGRSLAEILSQDKEPDEGRKAPFDRRMLDAFLKVCDAVAYAHSRGVVHRDLKPANIMLGEFGEVLVMDWGIAKIVSPQRGGRASVVVDTGSLAEDGASPGPSPGEEDSADRTMEGAILGTPAYMPPEQAAGEVDRIDARSDVYSLGAILYEILTGTPPYLGQGARGTLNLVLAGELEPPSERAPKAGVPRELEAVVLKAMAFKKSYRYGSVPELAADVRAYLEGFSVSAYRDSPLVAAGKWVRRHRAASVGAVAGLAALVLGVFFAAGIQRARTAARVGELVRGASARLAKKDYEGAQADATKALALDPEDAEAIALLGKAAGGAEETRRRREIAGHVESLRTELEREREAAGSIEAAGTSDRRTRYATHTRALLLAREIDRLAPGEPLHQRELAECARALAHVLTEDRNFEMADLMIDEAEGHGLDPALVKKERWSVETAQGKGAQLARETIAESREQVLPPDEWEATLDGLAREANDQTVATLLPAAFGYYLTFWRYNPHYRQVRWESRRLVVEALTRIGDSRTTALAHPDWIGNAITDIPSPLAGRSDEDSQALLASVRERWFPGDEPARVDVVQVFGYTLLALEIDQAYPLAVRLAEALGRFADPRGDACLNVRRWQARPGSSYWTRTADAYARIPLSELAPEERADPEARFWRARALLGKGKATEAILEFDETERLGAGEKRVYSVLSDRAFARIETGDLEGARRDLENALRVAPDRAGAHYEVGLLALAAGDAAGALEALQKARSIDPKDARVELALARAHQAAGSVAEALEASTRAIALDPWLASAYELRGAILLARGEHDAAVADASLAILADPASAPARVLRSEALYARGEIRLALEDAGLASVLAPGSREAWTSRARAHHAAGNRVQGIDDLRRAIKIDPESEDLRVEYVLRSLEVARHGSQHAWADAMVELTRTIETFPDRADLRLQRAAALVGFGQHREALADLDRALEIDPRFVSALVERASLLMGWRRCEDARRDLEAALALEPANPRALRLHAVLAAPSGDPRLLRERVRAALLTPQGPCSGSETPDERSMEWLALGSALAQEGSREEALGALERAKTELPKSLHAEIDEAIRRLREGR